MTTLITVPETTKTTEIETYEPTAADKIQRVLYRLDHGEKLIAHQFRNGDNFCVLGLFADESGLGEWYLDVMNRYRYLNCTAALDYEIAAYYSIRTLSAGFAYCDLPDSVLNMIPTPLQNKSRVSKGLNYLNDKLILNKVSNSNEILAAIIRSGVIFKNNEMPKSI